MNTITTTRRTIRREWTAFGALLILSVGLMGVSDTKAAHDLQSAVNEGVMPVETFINDVTDTVGSYISALSNIDHLRSDNERLRQENQRLQEELARMAAISKLNDDWTKITTAAAGIPYQTTPVRVIVRDISDVRQRTLIVNKGSNDGLKPGQVVIDSGGALVGRIDSTQATVSTILLVNDPSAVVIGKEVKSGALGTIHGTISGDLLMSYVDVAATLTAGESVVTAGEALPNTNDTSPYPPGLLIGKITKVSQDRNAVVQTATIQPAANLIDATFLLVILDYEGGFGPPMPSYCPSGFASTPSPGASPTATVPPECVPVRPQSPSPSTR